MQEQSIQAVGYATALKRFEASFPPEFSEDLYRLLYKDLRDMTGEQLLHHWEHYGRREGRRAFKIEDRNAFAKLIPADLTALEIGPFHSPLLSGENVYYFDILDREALIARAQSVGYHTESIPETIHYVSPKGDLSIIDRKFDVVLSSHVIEHQPDLVEHLNGVERLLKPGGFYFVLAPDKNYCFDHYIAESTIADVIDAHQSRRKIHTLRSQVEHAALSTHNNSKRHWRGDHGVLVDVKERVMQTIARYEQAPDDYVDVHAWYFNPTTFRQNVSLLRELDLTNFSISRVYPTLRDHNEFWSILKASAPITPNGVNRRAPAMGNGSQT